MIFSKEKQDALSSKRVRQLLSYNKRSGVFYWKVNTNRQKIGARAGMKRNDGGIAITVNRFCYQAGRIAWLYVTGAWPKQYIDHKNGIRDDNRWKNLRDVSHMVNQQNQRQPQRGNTSGFLGVHFHAGKYCANIRVNGKRISLGRFETAKDAAKRYIAAKRKYHQGCMI